MGSDRGKRVYYVTVMPVKDLVSEVGLAQEILLESGISNDLRNSLQRELKKARTNSIVQFLDREDRFISSIVVAAIGGKPQFLPVEVSGTNAVLSFGALNESFGALTFEGGQQYYALDGQHRLFALKEMVDSGRHGISNDLITVIMILKDEDGHGETTPGNGNGGLSEGNKIRYRRLFTWLNRYAKPTTKEVNIIMDEDDLFSIITRRLIETHQLFRSNIVHPRVNVSSNTIATDSKYFTTIRTLYEMTKHFLEASDIELPEDATTRRPDNDTVESCAKFTNIIWDALLLALGYLSNSPEQMRSDDEDGNNHMLFRPIGQLAFSEAVADLIEEQQIDQTTSARYLKIVMDPLPQIDWDLRSYPWLDLMSMKSIGDDGQTIYRMRDEGRKRAIKAASLFIKLMIFPDKRQGIFESSVQRQWIKATSGVIEESQKEAIWEKVQQSIIDTRNKIFPDELDDPGETDEPDEE